MIPVNRFILYFDKYNEELEELGVLIGQYDVSEIPLRRLKKIVSANGNDIFLYDNYDLNEDQLNKFNSLLIHAIDYSLDKFDYCLGCRAIAGYYGSHRTTGSRKGGYPPPG